MKTLVIDDSRVMRQMICRIIQSLGFETLEAANGLEGLSQLSGSDTVDLILVDWNMPEMNGLKFIKAVRRGSEYAKVPIIMITTEAEMERMALAFMAGVNEYIMKPFTADMIVSKLEILGIGVTA